jgi:hypothetical protein
MMARGIDLFDSNPSFLLKTIMQLPLDAVHPFEREVPPQHFHSWDFIELKSTVDKYPSLATALITLAPKRKK